MRATDMAVPTQRAVLWDLEAGGGYGPRGGAGGWQARRACCASLSYATALTMMSCSPARVRTSSKRSALRASPADSVTLGACAGSGYAPGALAGCGVTPGALACPGCELALVLHA